MSERKTDRLRIERVEPSAVYAALAGLVNNAYTRKKYSPTTFTCHLERYQYLSPSGEKIAVVYDTVAKILSADASPEALAALAPMLPNSAPKQETAKKADKQDAPDVPRISTRERMPIAPREQIPRLAGTTAPAIAAVQRNNEQPAAQPAPAPKKRGRKKTVKTENVLTIAGIGNSRFDWVVKDLKGAGDTRVRKDKTAENGFVVVRGKDQLVLSMSQDGTVTVRGKASPLFNDVRERLETRSNLRLLKKYVPTALRYLSESSRIDLSNGITDLENVGRLSDYSVLLTAPYRALEKLIYDLQQAENINVKMIGQAYEKDDEGRYSLKKGYIRRIGSVVYAEVMAALYSEYYATRNFYTHSDNSADSRSRGIADKAEAQKKLRNLLAVIEYNGKKLSEIGFKVADEQ